jgi:hypothetical protein
MRLKRREKEARVHVNHTLKLACKSLVADAAGETYSCPLQLFIISKAEGRLKQVTRDHSSMHGPRISR